MMMEVTEEELMDGAQFIFDPITKTVIIIRFDKMIAVPGRFETHDEAHSACLKVMMTKYANAYTSR